MTTHGTSPVTDDCSTPNTRRSPIDLIALARWNTEQQNAKRAYYAGDNCPECGRRMRAEGIHRCITRSARATKPD